jgi:phosphoglycolate phosphatase
MKELEKLLSHKSHIIWDWNGTLLNDVDMCVEVISTLLEDHELPKITRDDYRKKFGFPVRGYYESLGFDFKRVPFEKVADEFIKRYRKAVTKCDLFPGARELLHNLRSNHKRRHSILSAAGEADLQELVAQLGIEHHFDHIFGLSDNYAVSKIDRGHELIQQIGLPLKELVLVGDTDHDVEVASALGIDAILLADGHQTYERLKAVHPHTLPTRG